MRRVCILLLLFMLTVSCSTYPMISPVKSLELTKIQDKCNGVFPIGKWLFVHSIEATLPDGKKAFMMGVTQIYPEKKKIHCIMMTIEGLVVFDGLYDGKIVINRGIPPFASDNFAKGLISDLQLIFFHPEGRRIGTGVSDTGEWICRYQTDEESTVDVVIHFDNSWTIRRYSHRRLRRTVQAYLGQDSDLHYKNKIPERMELIARGGQGYSLNLKLVKAEPIVE
jgi:hypothetical protein